MHGQWLHKNYLQLRIQHCAAAAASDNYDGDMTMMTMMMTMLMLMSDVNRCPHVLA